MSESVSLDRMIVIKEQMSLKNIQSKTNGTYVETVALLAAIDTCVSTKCRMAILDKVLYLILNQHMTSLKRVVELRKLLNKIQKFVEFIDTYESVPLESGSPKSKKTSSEPGSSASTIETEAQIRRREFIQNLDHYLVEILDLTIES